MTNPRYGAGFPAANLDTEGALADWGNYCQAAQLAMSLLLDKQQPAARWLEEIAELTASAVVWSGTVLKIMPYGDQALSANGTSWTPQALVPGIGSSTGVSRAMLGQIELGQSAPTINVPMNAPRSIARDITCCASPDAARSPR